MIFISKILLNHERELTTSTYQIIITTCVFKNFLSFLNLFINSLRLGDTALFLYVDLINFFYRQKLLFTVL